MGHVTESIFDGKTVCVPLADVQHVEKNDYGTINVITKHTRRNEGGNDWVNCIWINKDETPAFLAAWSRYRSELESDTLADLSPTSA